MAVLGLWYRFYFIHFLTNKIMAIVAGISGAVSTGGKIVNLVGGLFGSRSGADARKEKRKELAKTGIDWRDAKGNNSSLYWNVNNFGDQALDNMATAIDVYGQYAIKAHNDRLLNDDSASSYSTLSQIIENLIPEEPEDSDQAGIGVPSFENVKKSFGNIGGLIGLAVIGFMIYFGKNL